MNVPTSHLPVSPIRLLGTAILALTASLALAACGGTPAATTPTPSSASAVTIKTASVTGLGTILVNSQGRTLYMLSSESDGHLTCTNANSCTRYWFEVNLPSGTKSASAGSGAQSALLGTETGATGTVVTYNGWPLYTYSGDTAAKQANGEGLKSYGGTWYVLGATGSPIKATTAASSPSSGGDGY